MAKWDRSALYPILQPKTLIIQIWINFRYIFPKLYSGFQQIFTNIELITFFIISILSCFHKDGFTAFGNIFDCWA